MAVFPRRYGRSRSSDTAAIVALEAHVKYMEEQIEYYASLTTKTILELNAKLEERSEEIVKQGKYISEFQEQLGEQEKIIKELKEKLGEEK